MKYLASMSKWLSSLFSLFLKNETVLNVKIYISIYL